MQQNEKISLSEEQFGVLAKYLQLETSPDETLQIEKWLNEHPDNAALLLDVNQLILNTNDRQIFENVDVAWQKISKQIGRNNEGHVVKMHRSRTKKIWWAAACIVGVLGMAIAYQFIGADSSSRDYKGIASVKLKDGSTVELEENGELIVSGDYNTNAREVSLMGNGNFDVAKDKKRPFIIHMGGRKLVVLGTSFHIMQNNMDSNYFRVKVTDGVVKVTDSASKNEYKLIAGQELSFSTTHKEVKVVTPFTKLKFDNVSLLNILNEIANTYRITFQNIPVSADKFFYTVDMSSETLDETLHTISILADLPIEKVSESIYRIK